MLDCSRLWLARITAARMSSLRFWSYWRAEKDYSRVCRVAVQDGPVHAGVPPAPAAADLRNAWHRMHGLRGFFGNPHVILPPWYKETPCDPSSLVQCVPSSKNPKKGGEEQLH